MWMSSEFLFESVESPDESWPWFFGPLLGPNDALDSTLLTVTRCFFGMALAGLLYAYCRACLSAASSTRDDEDESLSKKQKELVCGLFSSDVYSWLFVGPWIVKDIAWSCQNAPLSLLAATAVFLLLMDNFRRYKDWPLFAEMLWVLGNIVWLWNELLLDHPDHVPRIVACSLLGAGLCIVVVHLILLGREAAPH